MSHCGATLTTKERWGACGAAIAVRMVNRTARSSLPSLVCAICPPSLPPRQETLDASLRPPRRRHLHNPADRMLLIEHQSLQSGFHHPPAPPCPVGLGNTRDKWRPSSWGTLCLSRTSCAMQIAHHSPWRQPGSRFGA